SGVRDVTPFRPRLGGRGRAERGGGGSRPAQSSRPPPSLSLRSSDTSPVNGGGKRIRNPPYSAHDPHHPSRPFAGRAAGGAGRRRRAAKERGDAGAAAVELDLCPWRDRF